MRASGETSTPNVLSLISTLSIVVIGLALPSLAIVGCGDESSNGASNGNPAASCDDDELYDPDRETCVPEYTQTPGDNAEDEPDDAGRDASAEAPDPRTDTSTPADVAVEDTSKTDVDTGRNCDKDRDDSRAEACGGNDCDDRDRRRGGNRPEVCDDIDHNCDGEPRGGIDCSFYAHEGEALYRVNPFEETAEEVQGDLPGLHDLDTHPDGSLYGVTPDGIYVYKPSRPSGSNTGGSSSGRSRDDQCPTPDDVGSKWKRIKCFPEGENTSWAPERPQGLAIDRADRPGRGEKGKRKQDSSPTMFIVSKNQLYTATKRDSDEYRSVEASEQPMGTDPNTQARYRASGDCVTRKRNLYMTSKHDPKREKDYLVTLDPTTGKASDSRPLIDADNPNKTYDQVFGLTQAWGTLYGLTADGELIDIDPRSGKATLVTQFEDRRWFGAASTAERLKR